MKLKEKVKKLPSSPGVYLMKDSDGSIIYVGKSKNLKSRVGSYFQNSKNHSKKVEKLVHHLKDFDYILTDTEFEAFMLECKLIQELQPVYNRLMKNPQSYTYISISIDDRLPRIDLSNQINEKDCNLYFGPFTSKNTAEKAIEGLKEFFKIDCNHTSRKKTPCLNFSLGLCMGMCFDRQAMEKYHQIVNRMIALLGGMDTSILEEMKQTMIQAAENYDFEKAAKIRDDLDAINSLLKKEKVIEFTKENKNLVMIESLSDGKLKLFLIKGGKVLFSRVCDSSDCKQLGTEIKANILRNFKRNQQLSSIEIRKEEIDKAQIIFSYLNRNACEYVMIPEEWLSTEDDLDRAIHKLLNAENVQAAF